jgi:hypothetical protein
VITCPSCARTVDGEIADDALCPQCGTPLLAGKSPEVDPAWVAEKAAKADAHAAANAPKKRGGYLLLGLVMAVMAGAIILMVSQRAPAMRGGSQVGDIEITVIAPEPNTSITVDGALSGKTPVVLRLKSSTTPIKIIGNNVAIVVVPDRDRTVNLVSRKKSH